MGTWRVSLGGWISGTYDALPSNVIAMSRRGMGKGVGCSDSYVYIEVKHPGGGPSYFPSATCHLPYFSGWLFKMGCVHDDVANWRA